MKQLDMFQPATPETSVIWFPVARRHRFIKNIARILLEREGEKRQKRWRLECTRIECDLLRIGIRDSATLNSELASLRAAVEAEMRRQVAVSTSHAGGAA